MSNKRLLKSVLAIILMFPIFGYGVTNGLKGYYYNNYYYSSLSCKNIGSGTPASNPYHSYTQNDSGTPFVDANGDCYYIDPNIEFGWGDGLAIGPFANHPRGKPLQIDAGTMPNANNFWSIKWRGTLKIPQTNVYNFFIKYKTRYSLRIDGRQVFDKTIAGVAHEWRKLNLFNLGNDTALTPAGYHKFELDYGKGMNNGFIHLGYTINNPKPKQNEIIPIPKEWFFPHEPNTVSFTKPSFSAQEKDGTMEVSVSIDKLPEGSETVKVRYRTESIVGPDGATVGQDFTSTSGILTFRSTDTSKIKTFNIPITVDAEEESTETFKIFLEPADPNDIVAVTTPVIDGQIYDIGQNYEVEFTQPKYVSEEGNVLSIPIRLNKPFNRPFDVMVSFTDISANLGIDYTSLSSKRVSFNANQTTAFLKLNIINDKKMELGDELFKITLSGATNGVQIGTNKVTQVTIIDKKDVGLCFDLENNSTGNAVQDGWKLLSGSDEDIGTTFSWSNKLLCRNKHFPDFLETRRTRPYYFTHPWPQNAKYPLYKGENRRLRLSEGRLSKTIGVILENSKTKKGFPAKDNYIILEFDHYSYGGCVTNPGLLSPAGENKYGGDGMAMVLYDAKVDNPTIGAKGGALGYAQRGGHAIGHHAGFEGGWLAVGLDEYGNFSNSGPVVGMGEGKRCNLGKLCPKERSSTSYWSRVVIRGDAANGYGFLAHSPSFVEGEGKLPLARWVLPPRKGIAWEKEISNVEDKQKYEPSRTLNIEGDNHPEWRKQYNTGCSELTSTARATDYFSGRYRLVIDNLDGDHTWITVYRNIKGTRDNPNTVEDETEGDYEVVVNQFDAQDPAYHQSRLPENLKLAFTSTTGGLACNIREIGSIVLKANSCAEQDEFNNFRVIEKVYADKTTKPSGYPKSLWHWKWNSPLRTKNLGTSTDYCVLAGTTNDENAKQAQDTRNINIHFIKDIVDEMKEGKITHSQTSSEPILGTNNIYNVRINGRRVNKDGNYTITKNDRLCFTMNTKELATPATRKAYFYIQEDKDSYTADVKSSDTYALKPRNFMLNIYDNKNALVAMSTDKNETILDANTKYSVKTLAVNGLENGGIEIKNPSASDNNVQGYYSSLFSKADNKDYSMLKAILQNSAIGSTLECDDDKNLTLGKKYTKEADTYLLSFRRGEVKYDSDDNVENWNSKKDKFTYPLEYNNTMKFEVAMKDKDWTLVDRNDSYSFNSSRIRFYGYECNGYIKHGQNPNTVNKYGDVASCDINESMPKTIYFKPDHFEMKANHLMDAISTLKGRAHDYTYLASKNNDSMAVDLNFSLKALDKNGNLLTNYDGKCYATNIEFGLAFVNKTLKVGDKNASNVIWFNGDNNTSSLISQNDANATFQSTGDSFVKGEADVTVVFNFERNESTPINPFNVYATDFNLTSLKDTFDTYDVNTTFPPNENATFFYGKIYVPKTYKGRINEVIKGTTYHAVYCGDCNVTRFPMFDLTQVTNRFTTLDYNKYWFVNDWHNEFNPDGRVITYTSSGVPAHQPTNTSFSISNGLVGLTFESATPGTAIVIMNTSDWLKFGDMKFPVVFTDGSGWGGDGGINSEGEGAATNTGSEATKDVGQHIKLEKLKKKNRRIEW